MATVQNSRDVAAGKLASGILTCRILQLAISERRWQLEPYVELRLPRR